MPYLVRLVLMGIPANAWTLRASQEVLRGIGLVVKVAECTAHRNDTSRFWVWLRTNDPDRIPLRRLLVVEVPRRRHARGRIEGIDAMWYPVEIIREAPAVPAILGIPHPHRPSPPPPDSDGDDEGRDGGGRALASNVRRQPRGLDVVFDGITCAGTAARAGCAGGR